jgi:hypothetical protein
LAAADFAADNQVGRRGAVLSGLGLEILEDRRVPSFSGATGPLVALEGVFSGVVGHATAASLTPRRAQ